MFRLKDSFKQLCNFIKSMNPKDRTLLKTSGVVMVNGLIGVGKLLLGLYYFSDWLIINAFYYLMLAAAKECTLLSYKKIRHIDNQEEQMSAQKIYLFYNGVFQCLIGISYFFVSLHSMYKPEMVSYPGYLVFLVILISFEKIGYAIWGIYKTRNTRSIEICILKVIDFTDAIVSIVVTRGIVQVMLHENFGIESSGLLGIFCSFVFTSIGVLMLVYSQRKDG